MIDKNCEWEACNEAATCNCRIWTKTYGCTQRKMCETHGRRWLKENSEAHPGWSIETALFPSSPAVH